jgi:formylglycine-generating enzyme required for sulfatase activity
LLEIVMQQQSDDDGSVQPLSPIEDSRIPFEGRLHHARTLDQRSVVRSIIPDWCGPFNQRVYPIDQFQELGRTQHRQASVGSFHIARYQVTVWQYRQFIDDGGYATPDWWSAPGSDWKHKGLVHPSEWMHQSFDNHPVTGVCLYEAEAYCNWLTAYGRRGQWLASTTSIRLPSSIEWEIAARWDQARAGMRTWEYLPGVFNLNALETGYSQVLPVGLFPDGASPCGALDMAGNVWEWCMPHHGYQEPSNYELRGGCWSTPLARAGWNARVPSPPDRRANTGGFRVLLDILDNRHKVNIADS